ncbi:MAG: cytochrome bc complex cytochrome b subunit [Armatimonadetes bacterium]|nr:cytochrome bc complex cytochrome b subunit [Armatimonadota bacterium]
MSLSGIAKSTQDIWKGVGTWWQTRAEALDIFDEYRVEPAKSNPWLATGALAYFLWVLILVSGFWLVIYYIPTTYQAFKSIERIQFQLPLGWVMRGVHKYGADAFLIAMIIKAYRMYFTAEHRRPNELTWCLTVLLLMFGMFSGLTGYLLIWNQRAYWATKVFATFPTYMNEPYVPELHQGRLIAQIMLGGAAIGPATITRFYAGHYALSAVVILLVEVHFYRRGLKRMNLSGFQMFVAAAMLILVAAVLPAQMGRPADPSMTPERIYSDWYFLGLYHLYRIQDPFWATIFTMPGLPLAAFLVAWWDRRGSTRPLDRPFVFTLGITLLVYWLGFSTLLMNNLANKRQDPIVFTAVAVVILFLGAWWEVRHFSKRPGEPRPFPTMLDAVGMMAALVAVCYVIYPFQMSIIVRDASNGIRPVGEIVSGMIQGGWEKLRPWLFPITAIQSVKIVPHAMGALPAGQYHSWWEAILQNDALNMATKFYLWVLMAAGLFAFSLWDIAIWRRIRNLPRAQPPAEEPRLRPHPDKLYALYYVFVTICLLLVAAFGLIAEN